MIRVRHLIAILILFASTSVVVAYERSTHRDLSTAGTQRSTLQTDPVILNNLGLKESDKFNNSKNQERSIFGLIEDGADFEDNGSRSVNHFYDPVHNVPLSVPSLTTSMSSDWALEDKSDVEGQDFSYKHARQYLYDALTAKNPADRDSNFGKTFETLGHVVHHLQDMAQPQHVRNDPHCDAIVPCLIPGALAGKYNPSLYERYTRGKGGNLRFDGYAPLYTDAASSAIFSTPRKFWRTSAEGQPDISQGKGIAEFTNRNFVSAGTNFDKPNLFPSPKFDPANKEEVDIKTLIPGTNLSGIVIFYGNTVQDAYRPNETRTNPRASTESIFDAELKKVGHEPVFTLNRFNFDAAHEFLIPRAVAYSVGLIDYFFRGRLATEQASYSDDGAHLTVTLKLKNAIEPSDPAWSGEALYAKDSQDWAATLVLTCQYKLNGQDRYAASDPVLVDTTQDISIAPGQISNQSFTFSLPSVPAAATDVQFRIVFRGKLGQEDGAVAVGRAEPVSGFVFVPSYLPADGIGGPRAIEKHGSTWFLSSQRGLQAGNVDWKGWYVGDMPTKVLSWVGPPSRYFPSANPSHKFDIVIYQGGQDFAYTPYPVLGAAIAQDAAGREWLVAICTDGSNDIVYRRPNKRSDSPDLFDPVGNPDGWLEIGRFSPPAGMSAPDRPWFFNGTGTEAQTMRPDNSVLSSGLARLKMTLDAANVTVTAIEPIPNLGGRTITEYSLPSSWTINPPPTPPPCTSGAVYSYGDSAHGEITYGTTDEGEYIVAVDYTASGEIIATDRINGTGTTTETSDQNEQVTINCGPQPDSGSITTTVVASSKGASTYAENWQESLTFGATTVILTTDDHAAKRNLDFQSTDVTGSSPQVTSQYDSLEHINTRVVEFLSLDLRYGLVVVSSETFDTKYTASGPDAFAPINWQSTLARATYIKKAATPDIPVYSGEQSGSGSMPGSGWPVVSRLGPVGSVVAGDQKTYGPNAMFFYPDPNVEGSWAIDAAGDLFASQGYWDINQNRAGNWFSYLSGGDLTQLVPPAPPNAVYEPIGVIH